MLSTTSRRIQKADEVSRRDDIWDVVITGMISFANASGALLGAHDPIVVSFPGPIADGRRILHAPTVCGCSTTIIDLAGLLEEQTGRAVYLLNDVSAAAWHLGAKSTAERFMVVTISSGIGSKIFDRRHAACVLDEPAYAGEIGHMVVDDRDDAPRCDCGGRGHLGAIASGRGLERSARLRALEDPAAFVTSCVYTCLGGCPEQLSNEEHLVPAALRGDAWALAVIREGTRPLARTLLASIMAMGLERVFVIGGFAQALGDLYIALLRELMVEMSRYTVMAGTLDAIVQPGYVYGAEPCLLGCEAFLHRAGVPA